jgi:hypothetical protein
MADLTVKQNDTRPTLSITLKEGSPATPINLTTATSVAFYMKTAAGSLITRAATITSASGGVVSVTFQAADTATIGTYNCELQITWNDGGIETVPNNGYFSLEIVDDLGP